jgi:hypothetical protein
MSRRETPTKQIPLLTSAGPEIAGREVVLKNHRLKHAEILKILQPASDGRPFVQIYRQDVLPIKTRTIHLLGRKSSARISNTLLGFEVKSSFKRIHCPDMVTARYLKLFTEIGCHSIKIPYDPTVTARLVPELESAAARLISGTKALFPESRQLQLYVLRKLYRLIRSQLR